MPILGNDKAKGVEFENMNRKLGDTTPITQGKLNIMVCNYRGYQWRMGHS